jgi:hypothetical protein
MENRHLKSYSMHEMFLLTFPTALDPVNDIFITLLSLHMTFPTAGVFVLEAVTTFNTPGGIPATSANLAERNIFINQVNAVRLTSHNAKAEKGVSSAGFNTTVQPAARAGAHFLVIIALGKFHFEKGYNRLQHFKILLCSTYRSNHACNPNGLFDHNNSFGRNGALNRVPVNPLSFFSIPLDKRCTISHFTTSIGKRLSLGSIESKTDFTRQNIAATYIFSGDQLG